MSKQTQLIIQFFLCLFLGALGVHRFANKQWISASSMLILSFIPGGLVITMLWALVDLIIILTKLCAKDEKKQIENVKPSQDYSVSLSNSPKDKEEYEQRKAQKIDYVLKDFYFWDGLDVDIFKKNIEFHNKWICPYCGTALPEHKGNSFKCASCKNKIYKKREILTETKGLFTEQEKEQLDYLWSEYHKRTNFLEIYQYIDKIILPVPTVPEIGELFKQNLSDDKKKNIQTLLQLLHLGIPEYYDYENENRGLTKLRNCRFFEGQIQSLYGTKEQATNAYMQVLFLDMIDDFYIQATTIEENWENFDFFDKEDKEPLKTRKITKSFKEIKILIAPAIYGWAFEEDLALEKFEKIFKFNANSINESLKYKAPITPDEAWQKILEYRESLEKAH